MSHSEQVRTDIMLILRAESNQISLPVLCWSQSQSLCTVQISYQSAVR